MYHPAKHLILQFDLRVQLGWLSSANVLVKAVDGLLWFCDNCNHKLHEVYFELNDIEKIFLPHFEHYYGSEDLRTCTSCGTVMEVDPRFVAK
jgi:uncharacterized protein with PIN domain